MAITPAVVGQLAFSLAAAGLYGYSAYWALAVSRALRSRLYKRQALSVAIIGAYFVVIWLTTPFTNPLISSYSPSMLLYASGSFFFGFVLIFGRIDAGVRVARRSDPLGRDTLHWSRVRLVIWASILVDVLIFFVGWAFVFAGGAFTGPLNLVFLVSFFLILAVGSPALVVSALRSKDNLMRKTLWWFAIFGACVLTFSEIGYIFFVFGGNSELGGAGTLVAIITAIVAVLPIVAGYSLYKSARSLIAVQPAPVIAQKF